MLLCNNAIRALAAGPGSDPTDPHGCDRATYSARPVARWSIIRRSRRLARRSSCSASHISRGKLICAGKDRDEIGIAAGDAVLDKADAEAGAHRGQVRKVAVGPQREMVARDRQCGQQLAQERRLAIEADQRMVARQRGERRGGGAARQIEPMGVEPETDRPIRRATSACWLGRTMRTAMSASPRSRSSTRLDSASSIVTPGLARRNPASSGGSTSAPTISLAVMRTTPAASLAPPEAARIIAPAAAAIASAWGAMSRAASVGKQAARRADEQRGAQRALEFGDLAPKRRLGEAQFARRAGKTALPQNGEKSAVVAPIGLGHTNMYSDAGY